MEFKVSLVSNFYTLKRNWYHRGLHVRNKLDDYYGVRYQLREHNLPDPSIRCLDINYRY